MELVQRDTAMRQLEANKIIAEMPKLKLPAMVVPEGINLKQFVTQFLHAWSGSNPTLYVSNGKEQTHAGARRSLGDITKLAQYYLPNDNVCLEKVKNILKELLRKKLISTSICKQIRKRVFFYRQGKAQTIVELDQRDEFGWTYNLEKESKIPKKFSRG